MRGAGRYAALTFLLSLGLTVLAGPERALAAGWEQDSCGWRYQYEDGTYAKSGWLRDNEKWYFMAQDGYMLADTFGPDGRYLDKTGALVKNSGIDREFMKERSADGTAIAYNKYSHKLELWSCGQFFYSCSAIDGREDGDKEVEGGGKTPVGEFYICSKVEKAQYYKGMGLSYPNLEDAERGLEQKLISKQQYNRIKRAIEGGKMPDWYTKLGGAIMIHGGWDENDGSSGCISVENEAMDILWSYADLGTAVFIFDTEDQAAD